MQIVRLTINNFRGVQDGELYFSGDTALVGDNNTGKSTVLEAIDLVLGPERLRRFPPIDEHDFWCGQYTAAEDGASPPEIKIEV
ncbi:ATP-dependent nuclease, partial [Thiolapillus sp.]